MSSIIRELQRDALDHSGPVSDLLRKALVVARKLQLTEFKEWIEQELSGYKGRVPEYRVVTGQIRAWSPYNGWIPVVFEDPKEGEALSRRACGQSIAELEDLVGKDNVKGRFHMPFPLDLQQKLSESFIFDTEVSLFVNRSSLIKILDSVRNIVLNWALKLEEDGVLGEELAFSENERKAASQSPQNINNFYGSVHCPQIAQGSQQTVLISSSFQIDPEDIASFLALLEKELPNINLQPSAESELESEIRTVQAQINSPKPKKSIVKESLITIRNILEGAGGSAVGQLIIEAGKLLFG